MNLDFAIIFYLFLGVCIWLGVLHSKVNKLSSQLNELKRDGKAAPEQDFTSADKNINEVQKEEETQSQTQLEKFFERPEDCYKKSEETEEIPEMFKDTKENTEERGTSLKQKLSKQKSEFEAVFMGNLFNKIGAVAILIALCILIKVISPFFVFTAEMKFAFGLISGLFMIFGSFKIKKDEKMKVFSEVLMGTGFGAVLISIYCGAGVLGVLSAPYALALAILTVLAIYFIADKQKTTSTLVLGLVGGYMNPFFVNYHITTEFIFNYLLFLNVLSLIFVLKNSDKSWVNPLNLFITASCIFSCLNSGEILLWQAMTLWGIYALYDVIMITKEGGNYKKSLTYFNFVILTLLSITSFGGKFSEIGVFMAEMAIFYGILGVLFYVKTKDKGNGYFYSGLFSLYLAIFFLTQNQDLYKITLWAVEALIVAFLALRFKIKNMFELAVLIFLSVVCKLMFSFDIYKMNYEISLYNLRTLYFLAPVVSGGLISYIAKKAERTVSYEGFKFLSLCLVYFYIALEINNFIVNSNIKYDVMWFVVPSIFFIYALSFNIVSKTAQYKWLYKTGQYLSLGFGLFILMISELVSGFFSALLPVINMRLLAYLLLGANLMYSFKNSEKEGIKTALKTLAVLLGFSYIHFESSNIVHYLNGYNWLISVMWISYSGLISTLGIITNKKYLKITGIWLCILTVCRLFLFDFATLEPIYKLIGFITLGVVLMAISYIYNKKSK